MYVCMVQAFQAASFLQVSSSKRCISNLPLICHMTHSSHHHNDVQQGVQIIAAGQYAIFSNLLFLPFSLSTMFSNTNSLCFSLNVRDQVGHLYITVAHINNESLKTSDILHLPVIIVQGLLLAGRPVFAPRRRHVLYFTQSLLLCL